MACDPLTYSDVDASKWTSLRETIGRDYGISIDSQHGEASKRGFTLKWAYEEDDQTLEIQCTGKPMMMPCGIVNNYINGLAEKSGLSAAQLALKFVLDRSDIACAIVGMKTTQQVDDNLNAGT